MSVEFSDTEWLSEPLDGATLAAVAETISQMDEAGKTEWFVHYDYETSGDVLSTTAVTVKMRVTMPRWSGYGTARQAERDEWDRFCAALRTHEQGHIGLVHERLAGIDARLVGKSVDEATRAWQNELDTLRSASDSYDDTTDHGRNQGTIIDVSVGRPDASDS